MINNIIVQEATPGPEQQPSLVRSEGSVGSSHLGTKVGRNEECPCGSGKKFKKCHGRDGTTQYVGS